MKLTAKFTKKIVPHSIFYKKDLLQNIKFKKKAGAFEWPAFFIE
jgi:hypothetical protein